MRSLTILMLALATAGIASAQSCPPTDGSVADAPEASVLHGTLVYHDDLRQWLGFKLDRPACRETEIELVFSNSAGWREAKSFRGCGLTIRGKLYEGVTGYYSTEVAIEDAALKPDPSCHPFPVEPDPALVPIPANVKSFHVSISTDYRGIGHVHIQVWVRTGR
jgi:hypothetical protein